MRTINTRMDIEDLRQDESAPAVFTEHISEFFRQLEAEMVGNETDSFSLDPNGLIILLEAGDDLRSLNFTELGSESGECLRRAVEFVEKLNLVEVQAYRLEVMLDNDFVVTIFTLAGTHDEEAEQWLSEQAQRSRRQAN
ncbi:hypothetical protein J19TS2_17450 [Cohnella xylanilytica]|uniref:Uncharacterized protein n=1 Tax=Cohnella xylanilytica TaxID=557555 RepID=A0A841TSE1_9BACL|nr:hypothetical protein [Cohnella xylanilytica]MBB6690028.1 hypothetical protein [Cohnella xylanilytica]GIO12190.1 hypothetical protein J19TS2_17450 [Cohnella xylanilytica]